MAKNQNPGPMQEAAALLKDSAKLKAMLTSPEAKKLMTLLNSQKGSMDQAARQAKQGDYSGVNQLFQQLMNTPEGAELAQKMEKKHQ